MPSHHEHDPLQPHRHDPNFEPPRNSKSPEFTLSRPDGSTTIIDLPALQQLPINTIPNCYIVSTGHGTSGPFAFSGVCLIDLIEAQVPQKITWSQVEVISNDGFGNRVMAEELNHPSPAGAILLAYAIDGKMMSRQEGLVRMIVPSEKDDALRQVKWIGQINVR